MVILSYSCCCFRTDVISANRHTASVYPGSCASAFSRIVFDCVNVHIRYCIRQTDWRWDLISCWTEIATMYTKWYMEFTQHLPDLTFNYCCSTRTSIHSKSIFTTFDSLYTKKFTCFKNHTKNFNCVNGLGQEGDFSPCFPRVLRQYTYLYCHCFSGSVA